MNIKEDYVSFEVAKLLNDKGFNEPTLAYAYGNDMISYYSRPRITDVINIQAGRVPMPTLQMAMKWLREVHNLIIYIKLVNDGDIYHDAWGFVIYNKFTNEYIKSDKLRFKYEEAVEAAIKYCLENLI